MIHMILSFFLQKTCEIELVIFNNMLLEVHSLNKDGTNNVNFELIPLIFVPTFDTKVTEYLCSGCVFSSDKFRLFN